MPASRISILCVDENNVFTKAAEGILKKDLRSASYTRVENGRSALHHLSQHPVDLVLVGHHATKSDSLSLIDDIRKRKIDAAVIMISTKGNERTAVEAMKRGAYDYISKHELNADTLRSAIRHAMNQKRTEARHRAARERIQEQATQDGLTGLYNHIHFQQLLQKEFKQARRYGYSLYAIMIDLDDFKGVNDTYGHLFGDVVLQRSAQILKQQMRDTDILARYGGEEFVVACSHIKERGVLSLCERVRQVFAESVFENGSDTLSMTVSIGIASISETGIQTKDELIQHADEALYEAKGRGKNNVCLWRQKRSLERLIDKEHHQIIENYQNRFLGFTDEIITKFMEYSRSIVEGIEGKDPKTAEHSARVTEYAVALSEKLGLHASEIRSVRMAGLLHDIGKAGIRSEILYKKGKYTPREFRLMQLHPQFSVKMVDQLHFLDQEIPLILQHHERYDGKGYPTGRKGREISGGARILAICDAYDAMISGRSYRKKSSTADACRAISEQAGGQFDPQMADAFIEMIEAGFSPR